jgi:hypothetical protein
LGSITLTSGGKIKKDLTAISKNGFKLQNRFTLSNGFEFLLILLLSIQFHFNSRVGDDWPNSNSPSYILWRYGKLTLTTFWNEISYWTSAWANGQGRFFPVAVAQTQLVFTFFKTQSEVRVFYSIVFIFFCILWTSLIKRVTNQNITGTYFIIAFAFSMQFRRDFEPHIGFGQLLIWAAIWFGLSALMLTKALEKTKQFSRTVFSILSGFFYFISLCQYELTFLLLPVLFLFVYLKEVSNSKLLWSKQVLLSWIKIMIPVLTATLVYLGIVFLYLRPRANPDGAYVLGFDFYSSIRTFFFQFIASFPTAGHNIDATFRGPFNQKYLYIAIIITIVYLISLNFVSKFDQKLVINPESAVKSEKRKFFISLLIGILMICTPAVMISLQPAWWQRVHFGSSYLGVFLAEIGISIVIASFFTYIDIVSIYKRTNKKYFSKISSIHKKRSFLQNKKSFQLLTSMLIFITLLSNFRMIETTMNRDNLSASWSALTKEASFFSRLKDRDFLFSTTFNDAYEINVANVFQSTGIRLGQIYYPPHIWPNYLECQDYGKCPLVNVKVLAANTLANYTRGTYAIAKLTKEKGFVGDWPSILTKPQALDKSAFWYFNIFMITESTAVAYLIPMDDNPNNALARPHEVVLYTLISKNSPVITPAFMGICLKEKSSIDGKPHIVNGVKVIKWELPQVYRAPSGEITQLEDRVDIRQISNGSC